MPTTKLKSQDIAFCREMRDPIYDYVYITNYEDHILNSPIFQRLDRIFQMPTAQMVYPSAKHSRKAHSIGVMHLAHEAIVHLLYFQHEGVNSQISPLFFQGKVVVKEKKEQNLNSLKDLAGDWWNSKELDLMVQEIRIAAMLHDVGHAPFSHLFEDVCKSRNVTFDYKGSRIPFDHEIMSRKIISEKEDVLKIMRPLTPEGINDILDKEKGKAPQFVKELISSGYDCDKLDYLRRDSYATGTLEFGKVDYNRIIAGFRVAEKRLCVSLSAIDALMNSFDSLRYMYANVYYHRASRIFDFMIHDALSKIPNFLQEVVEDVDKFLYFNDHNFIYAAIDYSKQNRNDENKEVPQILTDFLNRKKLYREIYCHRLASGYLLLYDTNKLLQQLEKKLEDHAKDLEIKVDYRPKIRPVGVGLEELRDWLLEERFHNPITGETVPLVEVSKVFHEALKQYTILFRIFVSAEKINPSFDTNNKFRMIAKELQEIANNGISKIEKEYDQL